MENIECQIHQSSASGNRQWDVSCMEWTLNPMERKTRRKRGQNSSIPMAQQEKVKRRAAVIRTDTPMHSRTNCKFNRNYLNCNGTVCYSLAHTTISIDCNVQLQSTNFDYSAFDADLQGPSSSNRRSKTCE